MQGFTKNKDEIKNKRYLKGHIILFIIIKYILFLYKYLMVYIQN